MSATVYTTDLRKEECIERLQRHAGRGGWVPWVEGTIGARIRGDRFRLFAWGPSNVRNSFAPFFYGRLEGGTGSTRICGRFQFHPIVQAFLVMWFGGLVVGGSLELLLPSSAWESGRSLPLFVSLVPVGMILLGVCFVMVCRWFARGQMENLRHFLRCELKARAQSEGESEPDGAANGSQPIRSETNPTSSATGSRR
jgi:hypothetical protein